MEKCPICDVPMLNSHDDAFWCHILVQHTIGIRCFCGHAIFGSAGLQYHVINRGGLLAHWIEWKLGAYPLPGKEDS